LADVLIRCAAPVPAGTAPLSFKTHSKGAKGNQGERKEMALDAIQLAKFEHDFGFPLPEFMRFLYDRFDGFSGNFGKRYAILFRLDELRDQNDRYRLDSIAEGLVLFGSDGSGEAFCFTHGVSSTIVRLPFVPMSRKYEKPISADSRQFLEALGWQDTKAILASEAYEIVELTPVVFGGSPTNKNNKMEMGRHQHQEYVQFWNDKYLQMTRGGNLA
jgi:hypothetical protein